MLHLWLHKYLNVLFLFKCAKYREQQCDLLGLKMIVVPVFASIFNMFEKQVQFSCAQITAVIPVRRRRKRNECVSNAFMT